MDGIQKKIKHILVATDFSEASDYATSRAIEIAKATNAKLTIIHVVQKKSLDKFLDSTLKKMLPKSLWLTTAEYKKSLVQEKISLLSSHHLKINHAIISKGNPAAKILLYARKNKADLIVMGAHLKYSLRDTLVGTNAEYVAKKTLCPVLIIKNPVQKKYKKILVPVDYSSTSKKALNYALQLFPNADTRILHVGDYHYDELLKREDDDEQIPKNVIMKIRKAILLYLETQMRKFIKGYTKILYKRPYTITLGYPGPEIMKETTSFKPDLIVMGTQGHGRIHYLFIGSVANLVLTETNKDILLVPPKAR